MMLHLRKMNLYIKETCNSTNKMAAKTDAVHTHMSGLMNTIIRYSLNNYGDMSWLLFVWS